MDTTEKAFQYASEAAKIVVILSMAVITFTVTFAKEVTFTLETIVLGAIWLTFFIAAFSGIWVHLGMVTILEPRIKPDPHFPLSRRARSSFPSKLVYSVLWQALFHCLPTGH
jgi:hypothetical protein